LNQSPWLVALDVVACSLDRYPAPVRYCFRKALRVFFAQDRAVAAPYDQRGATEIGNALPESTEGFRNNS